MTVTSKFFKFCIVGLASNIANYVIFVWLTILGQNVGIAALFGYSLGMFLSFSLGYTWVFDSKRRISRALLIKYVAVYGVGALLFIVITWVSVSLFHITIYSLAWLMAAIPTVFWNFFMSRRILEGG